ncbi:MAG TPA: MMPL family transporter [Candidatus Mcinerneyibacterium sp.]|nr:MMPL family transporter [Candidatus Mcinerneyibacterium sp.]
MKKIFKYPWVIVISIILLTVFFAIQLPDLNINNEVKIFLPEGHPAKLADEKMDDIYGSGDIIAVSYENKNGSIFSIESLKMIDEIISKIEKIKNVDEVQGITNSDYIEGNQNGIVVQEIMNEDIENENDVFNLKKKILSWNLYEGNLYNDKFNATQMLIKTKKGIPIDQKEEIYWNLKDIFNQYQTEDNKFYIAGMPSVFVLIGDSMEGDLSNLIPFVIAIVLLILFVSFRNIGGVALPAFTVLISTVWALGFMSLLGISLTIVSTVIPVLLVAVGSAYGIHIISHYYDELRERASEEIDEKKHEKIVFDTIKQVGKPVFIAGITTMVGFGSLGSSSIQPIKSFGIFTALGVGVALLIAVTFIPSILLIRNKKLNVKKNKKSKNILSKILNVVYKYFEKKRIRVLIAAVLIAVLSIVGMHKIVIDSVMIEFFKDDTEIRQADKFMNKNFNGTSILNILVDGKKAGDLTDPEILKQMDNLGNYLENKYEKIGKVTTFADFIKRMNKVMNYPEDEPKEEKVSSSNIKNESTSSFGSESTSSFGNENTSSFGNSSSNLDTEETTSSFGEESTTQFGEKDTNEKKSISVKKKESVKTAKENISQSDLMQILNKALVSAKRADISANEFIELINRELNYKGEAYNEIPYDVSKYPVETKEGLKNLISQYLLLYGGSLDDLINSQPEPSKSRMMVQIKSGSNILTKKIENSIRRYVKTNFPEGYDVKIAGDTDMALAVNNLIVSSQIMSIIISLIAVFIIVSISYRSLVGGLFGVIPLSFALLINFGLMGFLGIKLDIATSMVASIAIGIGVDYTVHFLSRYHNERLKSDDLSVVTRNTLMTTGKAIIFNAISVAAGFAVLLFSNFNPLVNLGLLVSVTMITSSVASMTILPAMLNQFKPQFISKRRR